VRTSKLIAWAICLGASSGFGQSLQLDKPDRSAFKQEAVQFLYPEQLTIPAGKSTPVALHFRIEPGLHINRASYPQGTDFTLPADPQTKLNVYTGEFAIQAHITAAPGDHLVQAKLRYQACDQQQCMPPKTATVAIDVIGK
jgi:hypothetical protein